MIPRILSLITMVLGLASSNAAFAYSLLGTGFGAPTVTDRAAIYNPAPGDKFLIKVQVDFTVMEPGVG